MKKWIIIGLCLPLFWMSCSSGIEYKKMEAIELAKGIRNDSLFLEIHFGMSRKDFYAHCWELNKTGLIRQGGENATVMMELPDQLKKKAKMNFFPNFHEDIIYEMPVSFVYEVFAPWDKSTHSDSLQLDVLSFLEKQYGTGFITLEHPERGKAFVKVDGNRRISIFKFDDRTVNAIFTDLTAEEALNAEKERRKRRAEELGS